MNSEDFNVLPLDKMAAPPSESVEEFSFDDLWDDRPLENPPEPEIVAAGELVSAPQPEPLREEVDILERQKQSLQAEISALKAEKERLIAEELGDIKAQIEKMLKEGVKDLEQRKQALELAIEQLERRRESIRQEMRRNFAGVSQDLAIRVQGFKDYLVGSLQDLAAAAEQLELSRVETTAKPQRSPETPPPDRNYREENVRPSRSSNQGRDNREESPRPTRSAAPAWDNREENVRPSRSSNQGRDNWQEPQRSTRPSYEGESFGQSASKQGFSEQNQRIQTLLDRYRHRPDYYGPPWQLRRTFEPIHAERVQQWFFKQGGRGAIRGMGSRLQNILVASAIISVMAELQGDRFRSLVLANSPERLGEWRRGLQDCLGISRADFGPDRGVVLFESPEALIQKAERLIEDKYSPLIIIDDTEERLNFALLQFPYWLAFAPEPQQSSSYWY
jgi:prefoldin subunit 5